MMSKRKDEKSITIVPDLANVFPLPARVVPEPWEDLASLLSRAAVQMGYKYVSWLLRPEDCAYRRLDPGVCFLLEDAAYQYLGHLLQLSEEALYKLTFHRFLLQMQAPEEAGASPKGCLHRPLFLPKGHATRKLFLSQWATRVCPRCLAEEAAYGALYWNIGPVVACLKHHIFLIDCCPHCQGEIPLLRSSITHCPKCSSGDYRLAPTVNLPEDPLFLWGQSLVLAQLGVEEEYRGGVLAAYGESPLHGLLPWQYFRLLKSFRNVLDPFFPNHPLLQKVVGPSISSGQSGCRGKSKSQLSLGEWAIFALTFHALFDAWPDNFTALLESLPSMRFRSRRGAGVGSFGILYDEYLYRRLKDPAFAFLREAFEDYLKKNYREGRITTRLRPFLGMDKTEVARECSYLTFGRAMKLLGVSPGRLSALISRGTLRALIKPGNKKSFWLIEKADVEALLEEWKDLISLDDVAQKYLGISKQRVHALMRAELLRPARGRNVDGSLSWYFKREELERLEAELLRYAGKAVPSASKCTPLASVASVSGLSFVETLKAILGGEFALIDTEKEIPLFQRLVLLDKEVKCFWEECLRTERSGLNLLSTSDVMKSLGIGEVALKELVRQGALVGKRTVIGNRRGLLFQKEMVDTFRRTYVLPKEAAELLDVSPTTIYKYISRGILHPVGLPRSQFMLREEVEVLIPPDVLSIPLAAPLLNMSQATLYARVRAGHIPHVRLIQWPENKWLLSSDVERLRAKEEK
jgi:predicted DNA-binding transcriptional regulator AlpA